MTICPGSNMRPNSWGFAEKLLNTADERSDEAFETFSVIPEAVFRQRLKVNSAAFAGKEWTGEGDISASIPKAYSDDEGFILTYRLMLRFTWLLGSSAWII